MPWLLASPGVGPMVDSIFGARRFCQSAERVKALRAPTPMRPSGTKKSKPIAMKLISVNCGLPRQVDWHGKVVTTAIYKTPVKGRVALRTLNLDGDRQADLTVHGGEAKAVYCYPLAHYDYWKMGLPDRSLSMGMFGENFTTEGLLESTVFPGDRFSIGSAEVVVTQPRLPCYKLGVRFELDEMVKRFHCARRCCCGRE